MSADRLNSKGFSSGSSLANRTSPPTAPGADASTETVNVVLDAGANLTSSSDAAAVYPNWRLGIQDAVLREGRSSGTVSGPEECITVKEAIRTYTINGAWQDHMEDVKGSIEVGKLADLCVIDRDILEIDPHEIGEISVIMTIVGGKIIFDEI